MDTIWKRITAPPFRSILTAIVHLSLGLGICAVSQTFNTIVNRIESTSDLRFELSSRGEQFNWDNYFGHPWLSVCIGFFIGVLWHLLNRPNPKNHDDLIKWFVSRALGKRPKIPAHELKRHFLLLTVLIVLPALLMTFFLHISGAVFGFVVVATINGLNYRPRHRTYLAASAHLDSMPLGFDERDRVTRSRQFEYRVALFDLFGTAAVVVGVGIGAATISNNLWERFLDADRERAAHLQDHAAAQNAGYPQTTP